MASLWLQTQKGKFRIKNNAFLSCKVLFPRTPTDPPPIDIPKKKTIRQSNYLKIHFQHLYAMLKYHFELLFLLYLLTICQILKSLFTNKSFLFAGILVIVFKSSKVFNLMSRMDGDYLIWSILLTSKQLSWRKNILFLFL